MLRIKNITKLFGQKKVLDNVSVDIKTGSIAILLGQSGVGKSTLLRVLADLEAVDNGSIELDGIALDPETIHTQHVVGMVFQQFNLFPHLTVAENITLALEKVLGIPKQQALQQAHTLLQQYGLADKENAYITQLSGGQKQRLAIARTIALKPKIICMDEPTSALDPLLTTHVANTITNLAKQGYTVVIASHDTTLLEKLDCMIHLMHEGKIIESANTKEFMQNKERYPQIAQFVSGTVVA